ncbi:stage II sporulation protein M [Nocardioides sp. ChNu-153]|uniref:stage II sporulation protein M n=1 Tax=Nocardioides sp. ChNu-153 TaxID=2779364 RepID=UPI0026557705|nr:stage II sporulation protein M [Nocardioides sp. ChNu-153]MDN7120416.1 stage II sporulation protein M [Nocardioides sp. ChNu-153]
MDLDAYAVTHAGEWQRLDELSRARRLSGAEVDELMELYDRVGTQLSVVRAVAPDAEVVGFLSALLARTRIRAGGARTTTWRAVAEFLTHRFPAALYRLRWWWLATVAVNVVVFAVSVLWLLENPVVEQSLLSPGEIEQYVDEDFENYYSEHAAASFGARVWINNAWVAALCLALGVLGVPVVFLLLSNVVNVAMACAIMTRADHGGHFWGLILPHGLLELTAVFVAGGVGLRLFWSWVDPGDLTRGRSMAREGRTAATVALGLVLVLLVSGVIEAVVTPSPLPTAARIAIGVLAEAVFLAYVFVLGRRAVEQGYDGDVAEDVGGARVATAA